VTNDSFGFDGGPPPSLDIFGIEIGLTPFGWAFGLVVLPFALGVLARKNWGWSLVAFAALLLTVSSHQALLINVGGLAPNKIPFPWDYLGAWALASTPAALAGYLAMTFYEKRGNRKGV
jgi:hypothetical protein